MTHLTDENDDPTGVWEGADPPRPFAVYVQFKTEHDRDAPPRSGVLRMVFRTPAEAEAFLEGVSLAHEHAEDGAYWCSRTPADYAAQAAEEGDDDEGRS